MASALPSTGGIIFFRYESSPQEAWACAGVCPFGEAVGTFREMLGLGLGWRQPARGSRLPGDSWNGRRAPPAAAVACPCGSGQGGSTLGPCCCVPESSGEGGMVSRVRVGSLGNGSFARNMG